MAHGGGGVDACAVAPLRLASCAGRFLSIQSASLEKSPASSPALLHSYAPAKKLPLGGVSGQQDLTSLSWCVDGSCLAAVSKGSPKLVLTYCKGGVFTSTEISVTLGSPSPSQPSPTPLVAAAFSRTTVRKVLLAAQNRQVALYDVSKRKPVKEFTCKHPVLCLSCNVNDSLAAAGCSGGAVSLYSLVTNNASAPLRPPGNPRDDVTCVRFSSNRRHLFCSADDGGRMAIWDGNTNAVVKAFSEHAAPCTGAAFSPVNDTLVLSSGLDKRCVCYDADVGRRVSEFKADSPLTSLEALPDGRSVALGTSSGKVLLYDLRSYVRPVLVVEGPKSGEAVRGLVCQPSETKSAAGQAASMLLKGSRSKSKLLPRAQSSATNLMKENVPAPALSPVVANRNIDTKDSSHVPSPQSAGHNRDSFSSQIFSPLKEGSATSGGPKDPVASLSRQSSSASVFSPLGAGTAAAAAASNSFNQSFGVAGASHLSNDSLFSPLREHSVNSPFGGDASRSAAAANSFTGRGSFLKSPIDSFNKSITTPLVSPLVPISEEEMLATPPDEKSVDFGQDDKVGDDDEAMMPPPRLSKEEFSRSSAATAMSRNNGAGPAGDSPLAHKSFPPPSDLRSMSRKIPQDERDGESALGMINNQGASTTTASLATFKESQIVASTPFYKEGSKNVVTAQGTDESHSLAAPEEASVPASEAVSEEGRDRRDNAVGEIKAVLTAFPKAFLEARAADNVDAKILNDDPLQRNHIDVPSGAGSQLSSFQREYLANCVEEAMDEHCHEIRMFMHKMQYDMVRSFQTQREELQEMMRDYAVNEGLVAEVERLRRENQELRKFF